MRILYGVVGEGMGHATRSRVIIEHLLSAGHEVRVVVSGRAHRFLTERFEGRERISIEEIEGLHLVMEDGGVDLPESILGNLEKAPKGILKNLEVYMRVVKDFRVDLVVSDFESWAYLFARRHDIPVVSIDNMQILNRCAIPSDVKVGEEASYALAKAAVKYKLPGAYHYLITTFFFPRVRKPRATLVPPILRPEVLALKREPEDHVLVYQTGQAGMSLLPVLKTLEGKFRVYGSGREGIEGNVELRPFSETGFIDDLRTAKAVIASAGLSLMSEAVHLHVPMLAVPVKDQFEQTLNARYLDRLGYGWACKSLDAEKVAAFLKAAPELQQNLVEGYVPRDNGMTFACLDELVRDVELHEPAPDVLESENLGAWDPHPVDDD